ncbi:MAG TPA: hypothetical protein VNQ76_14775 [Planctomicrobium sp.]|nr:hypothetical protein [Planctomicrobium sp.]
MKSDQSRPQSVPSTTSRPRRSKPTGLIKKKSGQLARDLDGLERLQAMQSQLLREIRRQIDELQHNE